jgi:hypothetical protein
VHPLLVRTERGGEETTHACGNTTQHAHAHTLLWRFQASLRTSERPSDRRRWRGVGGRCVRGERQKGGDHTLCSLACLCGDQCTLGGVEKEQVKKIKRNHFLFVKKFFFHTFFFAVCDRGPQI